MSAFCIYLSLPPYLAEWYAHTCREHKFATSDYCPTDPITPLTPVEPIRGSYESLVLQQWLTKQPAAIPEPIPEDANLAIEIPYFKDKDHAHTTTSPKQPRRTWLRLSLMLSAYSFGRSCTSSM